MLEKETVRSEIEYVYQKTLENLTDFEELVPAAVSKGNHYPAVENEDWTDGFWIGMLHLAQLYRKNGVIEKVIEKQLAVFRTRLDQEIVVNHHDMGFLYSLSAVADYRLNHRDESAEMAIDAAEILMRRYNQTAKIFQAWGDLRDPEQQGRMIIDCNMNLPLLYFASAQTGDPKYRQAAQEHVKQAQRYLIRPDNSTFHTYYMDVVTGEPRFGKTAQGHSDSSCWARGQAWGIYGFPLSYRYTGDASLLESASQLADYFIAHLPQDHVAYWDLEFSDGSDEPRDTSAAAIAACGLLELAKELPLTDFRKKHYEDTAEKIMDSLMKCYTTKNKNSNGLLMQGVYSKPGNLGINECTLWGDYFYFEALIRLYQSWPSFW